MQLPPFSSPWVQILFFFLLGLGPGYGLLTFILRRFSGKNASRGGEFHHAQKRRLNRLGGLALVISFVLAAVGIYLSRSLSPAGEHTLGVIVLSSLAIFALGFWDDLRPLRAHWKLTAQIVISAGVYWANIRIEIFNDPLTGSNLHLGIIGFFATVLWLVTLTNLINLIDGIDGLAAGICLMLMFLLAHLHGDGDFGMVVMLLSISVAGALLSFLKFNYPPAKIYMGDGGAYFLGFLIGLLSLVNSHKGTVAAALLAPAFALALPFVDVSLAVFRRGLRGLPLFRPDQKHIHHHLITLGFSRERTVLGLYAVSLLCLALAFGVFYLQGRLLPLFTGLLFLVLLVSGHLAGLTRDWFTIGSRLGKSLALRKETRYALTLSRWLEMEVERHHSVDELWEDYRFIVKKLGFSRVEVALPHGGHVWQIEGFDLTGRETQSIRHQISEGTVIEFSADKAVMSDLLFNLLSDLAAETWYKAAARWQVVNSAPLDFRSMAVPPGSCAAKKFVRFYAPGIWNNAEPRSNLHPLADEDAFPSSGQAPVARLIVSLGSICFPGK